MQRPLLHALGDTGPCVAHGVLRLLLRGLSHPDVSTPTVATTTASRDTSHDLKPLVHAEVRLVAKIDVYAERHRWRDIVTAYGLGDRLSDGRPFVDAREQPVSLLLVEGP